VGGYNTQDTMVEIRERKSGSWNKYRYTPLPPPPQFFALSHAKPRTKQTQLDRRQTDGRQHIANVNSWMIV